MLLTTHKKESKKIKFKFFNNKTFVERVVAFLERMHHLLCCHHLVCLAQGASASLNATQVDQSPPPN
jgi:hypothetical protein